MKIHDLMTRDVRTVAPSTSLREAARMMADIDAGSLPVAQNDRLIGMLTDRDIAVRGVAAGKGPDATVGEAMTPEILYCFDDEEIEDVCENMADMQVRRLPVVDRDKRLVGIVSLSDLATKGQTRHAGEALEGIARPGGAHTQSADGRM
ncbi:MAG TPA: CBS domain-containing protein [Caulobacterales bacterium]|nr:CBS domain-containing protein [Caulobacterales bacterium]